MQKLKEKVGNFFAAIADFFGKIIDEIVDFIFGLLD